MASKRVEDFIAKNRIDVRIVEFQESTKTSQAAANVLGCEISQIGKSIVFVGDNETVVVILSGDKKVDVSKLKNIIGSEVKIASGNTVKQRTGYPIGGVPPFPHNDGVRVLIDETIERFDEIWVACGTPNSVMKMRVPDIKAITRANVVSLSIES
jgi:Cys-tRNA(Pro) deacylase